MARTFRITEIFLELIVLENIRIGIENARGFLRVWLGAKHTADVNQGIDEALPCQASPKKLTAWPASFHMLISRPQRWQQH
jgi:ABC-type uncharacterized transport system ATPase subunit